MKKIGLSPRKAMLGGIGRSVEVHIYTIKTSEKTGSLLLLLSLPNTHTHTLIHMTHVLHRLYYTTYNMPHITYIHIAHTISHIWHILLWMLNSENDLSFSLSKVQFHRISRIIVKANSSV